MSDVFDAIMDDLDPPMLVVTTIADGERSGCLVGFSAQGSIHPPRFVVFLSKANHTYRVAVTAELLAVHFLSPEHDELARLFGEVTGDEVDKFEHCRWSPGPEGVPVLDDVPTWFAGRILERCDAGDHVGFALDPVDVRRDRPVRPLTLRQVKDLEPGHPA